MIIIIVLLTIRMLKNLFVLYCDVCPIYLISHILQDMLQTILVFIDFGILLFILVCKSRIILEGVNMKYHCKNLKKFKL